MLKLESPKVREESSDEEISESVPYNAHKKKNSLKQ